MTPHTFVGWILFASMWLSGPIYGYAASDLIATIWDDRQIKRREPLIAGISGAVTLVLVLVLTFVDGL